MAEDSNSLAGRRHFLRVGGAALGAVLASKPGLSASDAASGGNWINAHSHIWTRDVQRYPLAQNASLEDLDPPSFTSRELLDLVRPLGVSRVVLIAHHLFYSFDNTYLTDAAQQFPDAFRVVALVDDTRPHPDTEMKRLLARHTTGFRITPWIRGERDWLDNPGMLGMWRCAAETGQAICCLLDPQHLPQVNRMCGTFRQTRVVIDHLARIGADGEIRDRDVSQLIALARHPQVYVKVSAFYALGQKRPPHDDLVPMVRRVYEAFGPERLMWASDAPYQMQGGNTYRSSLDFVREGLGFLTASDRDWLLGKTAEKVYFWS